MLLRSFLYFSLLDRMFWIIREVLNWFLLSESQTDFCSSVCGFCPRWRMSQRWTAWGLLTARSEVSWRTGSKLADASFTLKLITSHCGPERSCGPGEQTPAVCCSDQQSADPASESDVNSLPSWEPVKRFQKNLCQFLYFIFIFLFELLSTKFPQSAPLR